MSDTLKRIAALESERSQIYMHAGRNLAAYERVRLKEIGAELDKLWDLRRAEKTDTPEGAMPDNVRSVTQWSARRGARGQYRSQRRGGRIWPAEELLEQEVGA